MGGQVGGWDVGWVGGLKNCLLSPLLGLLFVAELLKDS